MTVWRVPLEGFFWPDCGRLFEEPELRAARFFCPVRFRWVALALFRAGCLLRPAACGVLRSRMSVSSSGSRTAAALVGFCAFLGHLFPVYFKFAGGKGVATALGVVLAIHPLIALIQIATWLLVALVFRYSSLAALVTAAATPLYLWLAGDETSFIVLGAVLAVLLFWRHRQNIERLIARTESKVRLGR